MQTEILDFIKFLKTKTEVINAPKRPVFLNKTAMIEVLEEASKQNLFAEIDDPIAWQNEVRKDRILLGRE